MKSFLSAQLARLNKSVLDKPTKIGIGVGVAILVVIALISVLVAKHVCAKRNRNDRAAASATEMVPQATGNAYYLEHSGATDLLVGSRATEAQSDKEKLASVRAFNGSLVEEYLLPSSKADLPYEGDASCADSQLDAQTDDGYEDVEVQSTTYKEWGE